MTADGAVAGVETAPVSAGAVELGILLCHASRIERALLREVRLTLAAHLAADAEADLWNSAHLAETRGLDGLTLRVSALDPLRATAKVWLDADGLDAERLRTAREIVERAHATLSVLVRLEEEIVWMSIAGEPDPSALLVPALRSLTEEKRSGIARWAARALPRLPAEVRSTSTAALLSHVAGAVIGRPVVMAGAAASTLASLALVAPSLGTARLGVRRIGDLLELGAVPADGWAIEVPNTEPRVVEVSAEARTTPQPAAVPSSSTTTIEIGWGAGVTVTDARGTSWAVPDAVPTEQMLSASTVTFDPSLTAIAVGPDLIATVIEGEVQVIAHRHTAPSLPLATTVPIGSMVYGRVTTPSAVVVAGVVDRLDDDVTVAVNLRSSHEEALVVGAPLLAQERLLGFVIRVGSNLDGWREVLVRSPRIVLADALERRRATTSTVRLLPAGQGTSVLVSWRTTDREHHVLVDTGPRSTGARVADLVSRYSGGRLDLLLVTHPDDQSIGALERIVDGSDIEVDRVWVNDLRGASSEMDRPPIPVPPTGPLPRVEVGGGAMITLLAPDAATYERAVVAERRRERPEQSTPQTKTAPRRNPGRSADLA